MKTAVRISTAALLFIFVFWSHAAGFKLPGVADQITDSITVPDTVVDQLGGLMYTIKLKTCKTNVSATDLKATRAVWDRLVAAMPESGVMAKDEKNWQWELTLANNIYLLDAEAFPGGKVIVYSGCCSIAGKDAAMMAFVLSHEMAHALARHAKTRFDKHTKTAVMSAAAGGSLKAADLDDKTIIAVMGAMGVAYETADSMPFAKEQELEADRIALTLMEKAGYDPNQAIAYLKAMQDICSSDKGTIKRSALDDHPPIGDRVANLKQHIKTASTLRINTPAG